MNINSKNQLEDGNITLMDCPKNTKKFGKDLPDTIVIHYTAGSSAESSARWLAKPNLEASAHLVIGRAGEIYQLVPFDTIAWHAGRSSYAGRNSLNRYSIGIELDNAGPVTKAGTGFISDFGGRYQPNDVVEAVHRNEDAATFWHAYTQAQLDACYQVCELLIEKYDIKTIVGHEEIAPTRKRDPGPAFPLDKFRNEILLQNLTDDEDKPLNLDGKVTATSLNIRENAGVGFKKVAKALPNGQKVKVLEEKDGWYRIETTITGWVGKAFIETK